jgi:hypothetical protein
MINPNRVSLLLAASILYGAAVTPAWAQNMFGNGLGNYMPGAIGSLDTDDPKGKDPSPSSSSSAQAAPGPASNGTPPGTLQDNTSDEKRMQRKYKANMSHLKGIIAKGDAMMKSAPNKDDKVYKKGKILKELGEKHLADMQANSPFQLESMDKKEKKEKELKAASK